MSDVDPLWEATEARLRQQIPVLLDQMIVTKWVLVAEVIDTRDGDKGIGTFAAEGTKTWETRGMLSHAIWLDEMDELRDRLAGE